ncbi:hypothetical protein EXM36_13370 [Clostridium botulinum]|nr:hypothetical protein RSJ13_13855 [Clostridium botulinum]AUN18642.1 hypothetical protein B2M06_13945 [Clostridium botulinum]MBN3345438.1 hypothetical protein [Clostridium botulinum]MBN3354592.1 hypothetical protein [Clostridium botulinum]MBN3407861.1 hypothetical protein [Clostridium botulinum]
MLKIFKHLYPFSIRTSKKFSAFKGIYQLQLIKNWDIWRKRHSKKLRYSYLFLKIY